MWFHQSIWQLHQCSTSLGELQQSYDEWMDHFCKWIVLQYNVDHLAIYTASNFKRPTRWVICSGTYPSQLPFQLCYGWISTSKSYAINHCTISFAISHRLTITTGMSIESVLVWMDQQGHVMLFKATIIHMVLAWLVTTMPCVIQVVLMSTHSGQYQTAGCAKQLDHV